MQYSVYPYTVFFQETEFRALILSILVASKEFRSLALITLMEAFHEREPLPFQMSIHQTDVDIISKLPHCNSNAQVRFLEGSLHLDDKFVENVQWKSLKLEHNMFLFH